MKNMERILTTLPASDETNRTTVVEVIDDNGDAAIELRSETLLESLGWVTQKRISLDSDSIKNLQCALNLFIGDTRKQDPSSTLVSLDTFRNRRKAG